MSDRAKQSSSSPMASSKEGETAAFLERSSRATRGKRMSKLLDEEIEEDEQFWNQDALKEVWIANSIEKGEVAEDVFDSDFDEDVCFSLSRKQVEEDDGRERKKRRLIFPGKPAVKKKNKKKELSKLQKDQTDEKPYHSQEVPSTPEQHGGPDDLEGERIVRKSTRTSVIVRQAERDAIRAALQATMKPIKRKKEGEEKRLTQEEMLLEAAQTEIMNLRNLERVLAREEEVKKRAVVHKEVYSGPLIRYLSKNGQSFLEFSNGSSFESELCTTPSEYESKAVCAITGLPAKYRDPKTGLPYATKEAFKIIRERFVSLCCFHAKKNEDRGMLFDTISGQGFLRRQNRSESRNKNETSYLRYLARFRCIPALDSEVSE
ncbi:hypothetical protein Scep_003368 [Stephania cephalantha]|uniref:Vps72/YL1 C-terminal domain-containing protein n=1 Tax=Stephania cephalantha TaxID=152367 RepID=A0AAP0KSW8_9MAGN